MFLDMFLAPYSCLFLHMTFMCVEIILFMEAAWGEASSTFPAVEDNKVNLKSWILNHLCVGVGGAPTALVGNIKSHFVEK